MNKQAIFFGTFAPLHKGHIKKIIDGKRKYQKLHIVVSGYTDDRGHKFGMPLLERYKTIRKLYKDDELVKVYMLNEDDLPKIPNGWDAWLQRLDQMVSIKDKVFLTSEKEYEKELKNRNLDVEFKERDEIVISGTSIREKPLTNWNMINKYFKKFFVKKVLIYGSASTGKTTLVHDLANFYNTSYSLEYAREYQFKNNVKDEELDKRDLLNIGMGQFNQNKTHIHSPATDRIFFADTDVMTTKIYTQEYLKDADDVIEVFNSLINVQEWDLILFIPPDNEYVDDNFRDMRHQDPKERWRLNKLFENELKNNNLKYEILTGDFKKKFDKSIYLIDKLIKNL